MCGASQHLLFTFIFIFFLCVCVCVVGEGREGGRQLVLLLKFGRIQLQHTKIIWARSSEKVTLNMPKCTDIQIILYMSRVSSRAQLFKANDVVS